MIAGYRLIDHTADFRLEIFGVDPASLFQQAAMALFDLISDPSLLNGIHRSAIEIHGDDWADLMVNWLRELLYCWNGDKRLVAGVTIDLIEPTRLKATLAYDRYVPQRHEIRNEIKAATYHQIEVRPHADGWIGRVILDV